MISFTCSHLKMSPRNCCTKAKTVKCLEDPNRSFQDSKSLQLVLDSRFLTESQARWPPAVYVPYGSGTSAAAHRKCPVRLGLEPFP